MGSTDVTWLDPPPPIVGEIITLDDRMTGFSPAAPKENRPYVVIALPGRLVRVAPQSTVGENGVYIPDDTVAGLAAGWFIPWSTAIPIHVIASRPVVGHLPERYLDRVLRQWRGRTA